MAKLQFTHIKISAITTTVGDKQVFIEDEAVNFGYDEKTLQRLKRSMGFSSRFVLSNSKICTSDLCLSSAENIFSNTNIKKGDIDGLLFISQTPDYKAPSTAIILQDRLGLSIDTLAYDINLGCSGFVYGLSTIYSFN